MHQWYVSSKLTYLLVRFLRLHLHHPAMASPLLNPSVRLSSRSQEYDGCSCIRRELIWSKKERLGMDVWINVSWYRNHSREPACWRLPSARRFTLHACNTGNHARNVSRFNATLQNFQQESYSKYCDIRWLNIESSYARSRGERTYHLYKFFIPSFSQQSAQAQFNGWVGSGYMMTRFWTQLQRRSRNVVDNF